MASYLDILQEHKWSHPDSYGGHSPDGDYLIYSRNRDSEIAINCNYEKILESLLAACAEEDKDNNRVYDFRAGHWACGWVEYIIAERGASEKVLNLAGKIIATLESYPIYDEAYYSEKQNEEIYNYWEGLSISERIDYIKEAGAGSIFQARREEIPERVYDRLCEEIY